MTNSLPASDKSDDPIDPSVDLERPVDDSNDVIPSAPGEPGATREDRIRSNAYAAAERRGFAAGSEIEDWLRAEQEIDAESEPATRNGTGA